MQKRLFGILLGSILCDLLSYNDLARNQLLNLNAGFGWSNPPRRLPSVKYQVIKFLRDSGVDDETVEQLGASIREASFNSRRMAHQRYKSHKW